MEKFRCLVLVMSTVNVFMPAYEIFQITACTDSVHRLHSSTYKDPSEDVKWEYFKF